MSKRLWYKRYPSDFIAGTILLTAEQKGIYTVLLDLMYDRGTPIVDDAVELGRICGCSTRRFKTAKVELAEAGKIILRDGLISNPRFENQILNEEKEHEKLGLNGRKGAEKTNKKVDVERKNNGLAEKGPPSQNPALLEAKKLERERKKDAELPLGHGGDRNQNVTPIDPDRYLFERGKQVLGKGAGGLIAKLKAAKEGDVGKAISAIEAAAKRSDPREYVGAIIRGKHSDHDQVWRETRYGIV